MHSTIKKGALLLLLCAFSSCVFTQKDESANYAFYQKRASSSVPAGATGLTAFQLTYYPFARKNCISCHGGATAPLIAVSNISNAYAVAKDASFINFSSVSTSKLATYAGNGHCGTSACSGNKDAAVVQLQAWADVENANAVPDPEDSGSGPVGGGGPVTGGPASGALISQPVAIPLPLPSGATYKVMRWPLSQLTPASALTVGAIFEIEVQQLSTTTYRVRNPRILGLKSVVRVSGIHIFVKPTADAGIGVEDLGAGSVWENVVANAPISSLPENLPTGPIITNPAVPALDPFANIIGVRSNQDSFVIAFDKVEASAGLTATYASIHLNILVPKCLSCHSSANRIGGVSYSTHADSTAANNFNAIAPAQSRLYLSTLGGNASMPIGGTKLTAAESAILLNWLNAGAPNN